MLLKHIMLQEIWMPHIYHTQPFTNEVPVAVWVVCWVNDSGKTVYPEKDGIRFLINLFCDFC